MNNKTLSAVAISNLLAEASALGFQPCWANPYKDPSSDGCPSSVYVRWAERDGWCASAGFYFRAVYMHTKGEWILTLEDGDCDEVGEVRGHTLAGCMAEAFHF